MTGRRVAFWVVAVLWSLAYGWYAMDVFNEPQSTWYRLWPNTPHTYFLVIVNTLGNLVGWFGLYYLRFIRFRNGLSDFEQKELTGPDITVAIVAFLGITGYLPTVLTKITGLK